MPRILVADDNTNIQKMVGLAFQGRGIEVTAVGNGEAAVRRIPDLNPDLVLADIFMPVRNGYELCEWIKKDSKYSHIPVILLVGAFDPLDEKEARRVGADGVLKKPFIPPDPLIAMVVAALEKNPKIAAELHQSKEPAASQHPAPAQSPAVQPLNAPSAPPAPAFVPPASAIEIPSRIAPKPLPSFPEPTPDEAELAYAFGTGQRAMDALADSEEAKALKSQDEAAEDFDGASTTSDWRRSRMDFEVPEESANKPAFSGVDELDSNFSPEKVASQKVSLEAPVREIGIRPQQNVSSNAEVSGEWNAPMKELPAAEIAAPSQEIEASAPPAQEVDSEVAIEPEPSFASRATHWMDLMASASELPPQDWFASTAPAAGAQTPEGGEPLQEVSSIEESPEPLTQAAISQEEEPSTEAASNASVSPLPSEEDSFFAEEADGANLKASNREPNVEFAHTSEAVSSAVPVEAVAEARSVEIGAKDSLQQEHEQQHDRQNHEHDEPTPAASTLLEETADWLPDPEDSLPSYKEPDLVEPPAVHVTPEPLLVTESHHDSPVYGARYEEIRASHSFQLPVPENRTEEDLRAGHSVVEHSSEQPTSPVDFPEDHAVSHSSFEFTPAAFDERMPTVPSPLREDLDEIPYLNPPPDFHDYAEGHSIINHCAADPLIVDAVVEKVMQRIEPQLRELLSQNVLKPLVESLLQGELEKKRR